MSRRVGFAEFCLSYFGAAVVLLYPRRVSGRVRGCGGTLTSIGYHPTGLLETAEQRLKLARYENTVSSGGLVLVGINTCKMVHRQWQRTGNDDML